MTYVSTFPDSQENSGNWYMWHSLGWAIINLCILGWKGFWSLSHDGCLGPKCLIATTCYYRKASSPPPCTVHSTAGVSRARGILRGTASAGKKQLSTTTVTLCFILSPESQQHILKGTVFPSSFHSSLIL